MINRQNCHTFSEKYIECRSYICYTIIVMKERDRTELTNEEKVHEKIYIEGVGLDYSNVSDLMEFVSDLFIKDGFHSVEEICISALEEMEQDGRVLEALQHLDLALIGDSGILNAAGLLTVRRRLAVENLHFFKEMMFFLEENNRSIFIIGSSENIIRKVQGYIQRKHPQLKIAGTGIYVQEDNAEDNEVEDGGENLVNEMNSAGTDVILSVLPTPEQEIFLNENHTKISAKLWYGPGQERFEEGNSFTDQLRTSFRIRKLRKRFGAEK